MNADHHERQRIKLMRQIAQDKKRLAALEMTRANVEADIQRAERLLAQVERKLRTG